MPPGYQRQLATANVQAARQQCQALHTVQMGIFYERCVTGTTTPAWHARIDQWQPRRRKRSPTALFFSISRDRPVSGRITKRGSERLGVVGDTVVAIALPATADVREQGPTSCPWRHRRSGQLPGRSHRHHLCQLGVPRLPCYPLQANLARHADRCPPDDADACGGLGRSGASSRSGLPRRRRHSPCMLPFQAQSRCRPRLWAHMPDSISRAQQRQYPHLQQFIARCC